MREHLHGFRANVTVAPLASRGVYQHLQYRFEADDPRIERRDLGVILRSGRNVMVFSKPLDRIPNLKERIFGRHCTVDSIGRIVRICHNLRCSYLIRLLYESP